MSRILKSRYIKILLVSIPIFIVLSILFLNVNKVDQNNDLSNQPRWLNELILTFNEKKYTVTTQTTNDIGDEIGIITYHSIGHVYHLHSINDVNNYKKIAVKTKDGYLIAVIDENQ